MIIANTKEKILHFIDYQHISRKDFFEKTGIKRGFLDADKLSSAVSDNQIASIIASFPELDIEWLLTGKGEMLKNIDDNIPVKGNDHYRSIPLVDAAAVAGFGNEHFAIQESDVKEYYTVPKFKDRKIDFMIEVSGSSMYPKYNSGDVVACTILKESRFIQWGKVHVVGTREQGILIKRLYPCEDKSQDCIRCQSDNDKYPEFEVLHSEIMGIALVVGVIRLE